MTKFEPIEFTPIVRPDEEDLIEIRNLRKQLDSLLSVGQQSVIHDLTHHIFAQVIKLDIAAEKLLKLELGDKYPKEIDPEGFNIDAYGLEAKNAKLYNLVKETQRLWKNAWVAHGIFYLQDTITGCKLTEHHEAARIGVWIYDGEDVTTVKEVFGGLKRLRDEYLELVPWFRKERPGKLEAEKFEQGKERMDVLVFKTNGILEKL